MAAGPPLSRTLRNASTRSNTTHSIAHASPSPNDSNLRSHLLYQAVARNSVFVRWLWLGLMFDELPLIAQPPGLGALGVSLVVIV